MDAHVHNPGHVGGQACPPSPDTAVVTGGQGDLGKAIAARLKEAGLDVQAPGRAELDVGDAESVKRFIGNAASLGLLVCNAGVTLDKPLAQMSEQDWDEVMRVNLRGAFLCAREGARTMVRRRSGHIVFISSFSAVHPPAGQANYAAAKSALLGMMKSMAQELGSRGVRVNAVLPGFLETKMTEGLPGEVRDAARARHALGRFNTPDAVAGFVTFLHQRMPHTSGQVFNLDSRTV